MRVLSASDVATVLDLDSLLPVVENAIRQQGRGEVERPDRPHFPIGAGLNGPEPAGMGLVMPAYIHGQNYFATKLVGVNEENSARGLPTVNATIALTEADTGLPAALLAGNDVTNARTGCIGGLAVRALVSDPDSVRLGVIGAGAQARWQTRAIAAATDVDDVAIYSPSESRDDCAADLRDRGIDAAAVSSPAAAVRNADAVVTATTATEPVFDGADLRDGAVVVAIGAYTAEMRELDERTIDRAATLVADVPEEVADTGDFPRRDAADFVPFASVLDGDDVRESESDVVVVASVGTAVLDAAAGVHVYERARELELGTETELYS